MFTLYCAGLLWYRVAYTLLYTNQVTLYTLRQKFSIIAFHKGSRNVGLTRITVIQNFDAIVPIRCHGNKGSNSDVFWFKIGSY